MPEYLAPGVYVEETSFRSKSIEGVSTTTTGFIGPTRYGPVTLEPDLVTSLGEFERVYGGGDRLDWGSGPVDNHLWHAARAFFTEGGRRLYVSRVFRELAAATATLTRDGHAAVTAGGVSFRARYPGVAGNLRLRITLRSGRGAARAQRPRWAHWHRTTWSGCVIRRARRCRPRSMATSSWSSATRRPRRSRGSCAAPLARPLPAR
jgi:hypothetical protein